MRMLKLLTLIALCFVRFSNAEEACVTVNPSTGTYTVDSSGSADRPRPKCDLKKHNRSHKKSLKKAK